MEQRRAILEKQIGESLSRIGQATRTDIIAVPMTTDHSLLDDNGIMKTGGLEAPEVPATKGTLQSIAEPEDYLGIVPGLLVETVPQQPQSLGDKFFN